MFPSVVSSLCLLLFVMVVSASDAALQTTTTTTNNPSVLRSTRVAIITGGTRGIGRGITEALADSGRYKGFLLTYNTNKKAAESFASELRQRIGSNDDDDKDGLRIKLIGGDISLEETRDAIFECLDSEFSDFDLCAVVHNAGQYVGITSENAAGLEQNQGLVFGDGSLLDDNDDKVNLDVMRYYQRMYGEAYVDLCERGLKRMRDAFANDDTFRGSLIGISAPGCNVSQRPSLGYDMPGSGKCVMEYAMRLFAVRAGEIGVNCNAVIPGITKTEAWDRLEESIGMETGLMYDKVKSRSPMGKGIDPSEIGDVVAFLCGDGGGRFITGVSLPVDAGLHLRIKEA